MLSLICIGIVAILAFRGFMALFLFSLEIVIAKNHPDKARKSTLK